MPDAKPSTPSPAETSPTPSKPTATPEPQQEKKPKESKGKPKAADVKRQMEEMLNALLQMLIAQASMAQSQDQENSPENPFMKAKSMLPALSAPPDEGEEEESPLEKGLEEVKTEVDQLNDHPAGSKDWDDLNSLSSTLNDIKEGVKQCMADPSDTTGQKNLLANLQKLGDNPFLNQDDSPSLKGAAESLSSKAGETMSLGKLPKLLMGKGDS